MVERYCKVFAKNIIQEISDSGMTLVQASEQSNLSVSFLSKIKHYERSISLYNAIKLAKLVNKSLDELTGFNLLSKDKLKLSDLIMLSGIEVDNHILPEKSKFKLDEIVSFITSNEFNDSETLKKIIMLLQIINEYKNEVK